MKNFISFAFVVAVSLNSLTTQALEPDGSALTGQDSGESLEIETGDLMKQKYTLAENSILKTASGKSRLVLTDNRQRLSGFTEISIARDSEIEILSLPQPGSEDGSVEILVNNKFVVQVEADSLMDATIYFETDLAAAKFMMPVKGRLRSKPGMRFHPILKVRKFHAGFDYAAVTGTPVVAASDGTVVTAGWSGGYGKMVAINHTGGIQTRYAHLSKITTRKGAQVKKGQLIGKVGSTGRSTGPHLHFEKR